MLMKSNGNPLKIYSKYFFIGEKLGKLEVKEAIFMDDATDSGRQKSNNMFVSPKVAQKKLEQVYKVLKGKK